MVMLLFNLIFHTQISVLSTPFLVPTTNLPGEILVAFPLSFEVFGNLTLFQHQRCTRWSICNRITNPVYRSFFSFRL